MGRIDEGEEGVGIGWLMVLVVLMTVLIVGYVVYSIVSEPYRVADSLRGRLRDVVMMGNMSEDYRQGWLDCVRYYINVLCPSNVTGILFSNYNIIYLGNNR